MRTIFVSEKKNEVEAAREALTHEMAGRGKGMPKAVSQALDTPLDARALIGSPEEVTRRLSEERDRLGLDLLVARPQIGRLDRDVLERSLTSLAQDVWPAVIHR
jgi:alkanesulfonate monooxygenase SsuD/methylene tetrahydromethanopterin reductase-like flavin-dependent oxidoreductase (luciferase family)